MTEAPDAADDGVHAKVALAVVHWLEELKKSDETESLAVAQACLREYFGLDEAARWDDTPLTDMVADRDLASRFAKAKAQVEADETFAAFCGAAEAKGFFEGSGEAADYQRRFLKVVAKYGATTTTSDKDELRHAVDVLAKRLGSRSSTEAAASALLSNPTVLDALLECPDTRSLALTALKRRGYGPVTRGPSSLLVRRGETTTKRPSF